MHLPELPLRARGFRGLGRLLRVRMEPPNREMAELDAENAAYKPMTSQARLYVRQFQFDDYFRFLKAYGA